MREERPVHAQSRHQKCIISQCTGCSTHENDSITTHEEHVAVALDGLRVGMRVPRDQFSCSASGENRIAHPDHALTGLLVDIDDVDGLLDLGENHVHVAVVGLH